MTFADDLLDLFHDPSHVWQMAYSTELETLGQRCVLTMALLPPKVTIDQLEAAVAAQSGSGVTVLGIEPALRVLDDTFFALTPHDDSVVFVRFRNPGILDFALGRLEASTIAITQLRPFSFFEQVVALHRAATESRAGAYQFPRMRRYFEENQAGLFVELAQGLRPAIAEPVGKEEVTQLLTVLEMVDAWPASEQASTRAQLRDVVEGLWEKSMGGARYPSLEVIRRLHSTRVRGFLKAVLRLDPIDALRESILSRADALEGFKAIEELRKVEEFTPELDEVLREKAENLVRSTIDELDDDGDRFGAQVSCGRSWVLARR